jgi:UDP-N-acetylglucosamine 4,6-dehydratase/5-epimerase
MKILITGGNGFLGKRLGQKLKGMGHEVLLASRNNKQNFLAREFSGCEIVPMDISNIESVRDAFEQFEPEIVIHGAATKFVDLAEKQPMETIDINVLGSQNIARIAIQKNVKLVIGISTDKSSPPVRNIYGMTKSLMERMFCLMEGKSDTHFVCVRYGNVAWSTGSVLGIWKKMLKNQGYFGTTGPEMFRYFFTVDEAVNLVLTALHNAPQLYGKVLSREMKAAQLEDILKVWSKQENVEYKKIEGRPGERLEEFLIGDAELEYTEEVVFDKIKHYILSFNEKPNNPLKEVLSSRTAEKLSDEEIKNIINNPPYEEL